MALVTSIDNAPGHLHTRPFDTEATKCLFIAMYSALRSKETEFEEMKDRRSQK